MTTANLIIGANADDGFIDNSPGYYFSSCWVGIYGGVANSTWWRFSGTGILPTATVSSAVLTLRPTGVADGTGQVVVKLCWESADSPTAPSSNADYVSRSKTTGTAWTLPAVPSGDISSPNMAADLQSVINRPGFAGTVQLFGINNGSPADTDVEITDYNASTTLCARLSITYTGGTAPSATGPSRILSAPGTGPKNVTLRQTGAFS